MIDLGSLRTDNGWSSYASAVSADGAVVVGRSNTDTTYYHAFRWDASSQEMRDLGTLHGQNDGASHAYGVSADGAVVVGSAWNDDGVTHAFRWDSTSEQMIDLGTLRSDNLGFSRATAVSANGTVVIGNALNDDGAAHAFRWDTTSVQMVDLGTLRADNSGSSYAADISADGNIVVGGATADNNYLHAYRWDTTSAQMTDLGSLRTDGNGYSQAYAVSADGTVVVGYANNNEERFRAFRWDTTSAEMVDLGTLRADNSGYSVALAVSADGSVVVGVSDDDTLVQGSYIQRAFIWRTQMQNFENLVLSYSVLANDTEIAVAQQQATVGQLMEQTCRAEAGQSCVTFGGARISAGGTGGQGIGRVASGVGTLSYGRGLTEQTTLGGTLSLASTTLHANGFDMGNAVGVSLWADYSQGGLSRTGWQAEVALGYGRESGDITRGRGIENIMLATGDADLNTLAARATLGYGLQQQDWLITPSLTLAHFRSTRSAYAETGADFNATYGALSSERTTVTLAIAGAYKVSDQGTLRLGAGLEHDLNADRVSLRGASTLPGMESFAVSSSLERRETRKFFDVGYSHILESGHSISSFARIGGAAYGTTPQVGLGISYSMRF